MVVNNTLHMTGSVKCRLSLLRRFTSVVRPPIQKPQSAARFPTCRVSTQKGQFSARAPSRSLLNCQGDEAKSADCRKKDVQGDQEHALGGPGALRYHGTSKSKAAERSCCLLSERHRIPDMPDSPPPILKPLVQKMSVDLGLDDLSVLDLRGLDPPPALGANLLMLIGTSRSEKHLHVSADRLCRWLRSTYQLRPNADGLLGRNELKLKLKRKLRQAKLLGSISNDNGDDGVRSGWVCVDIGVVESQEREPGLTPDRKGLIGFGRRAEGVRIVVQMLTEEKREAIDLENLWQGIIQRGSQLDEDRMD